MNTPSLIVALIFIVIYFGILYEAFRWRRRAKDDKFERRIMNFLIIIFVSFGVIATIAALNAYGIGRLPLVNEVRSKLPESFTPNDRPVNPPVNRSIQPPSQQMFEEHQRQMEKLKRDGL